MRRLLLLAILGTAAAAGPARAQLNIAWETCGPAGTASKMLACGDPDALDRLVVSFKPTAPVPQFKTLEATIDIYADGPLPPFWQLFDCNGAAVTVTSSLPPGTCASLGTTSLSWFFETPYAGDPTRARLTVWATRPSGTASLV